MAAKVNRQKVIEEVASFKEEYPEYTDEHVSDYLQCLDDFSKQEKTLFATMLGY